MIAHETRRGSGVPFSDTHIDRSSTVDKVAEALRDAMFDGALSPGEQLPEVRLSSQLSVARSTVREALHVLTGEGLTTRVPNRGVIVRQLTVVEVDDIFLARLVLETQGARAAETCSDQALDRVGLAVKRYAQEAATGRPSSIARAHEDVHAAIVGLIGSQRLAEAERALMREAQLPIASIDRTSDDLPKQIDEHRELYRLLRDRMVDEAVTMTKAQLDHAKAYVARYAVDAPDD
jgi:DNA-binding GntR family transcriptional regulator